MQGRKLHDSIEPKYLNLPGAKEHLYNEDALVSKHPLLVEGPIDAIIATQAGYDAAALLGTQFSPAQASKFDRCDAVYVVLDPDQMVVSHRESLPISTAIGLMSTP